MPRNFLRTLLALAALFMASAAPTLHATQHQAKAVTALHEMAGPGGGGGSGGGNGGDPNPCDDCAVRAL